MPLSQKKGIWNSNSWREIERRKNLETSLLKSDCASGGLDINVRLGKKVIK